MFELLQQQVSMDGSVDLSAIGLILLFFWNFIQKKKKNQSERETWFHLKCGYNDAQFHKLV